MSRPLGREWASDNNNAAKPMLKISEASRLLHVHENTLRRWSKLGIIKARRLGPRGDRRFRQKDIAALLIEQTKDREADAIRLSHQ